MVGEIIVKVKPDTKELDKELKKPRTFAGLLGFGGIGGGGGDKKDKGTKDIVSELKNIGKKSGITAVIIGALWTFIKPVLEIVKAISALLFLAFSPVILPAFKLLVKMLPFLKSIAEFIKTGLEKLIGFFSGGVDFVIEFFKSVWTGITKAWDVLKTGGKWLWENIILPGFNILLKIGKFLFDSIIEGFKIVYVKIPKFLFDSIIEGFKVLFTIGKFVWNKIKSGLSFISNLGVRIWSFFKDALSGIKNLLIDGFKTLINGVISAINFLIPGQVFDIPKLASGGIVTRPTLALIGERGPEAVIPLNQSGSFGGATITNHFNLGPINNGMDVRSIAEEIAQINKDELAMSTGSQRF